MEQFIDTQEWVPIHTLPGFECCIEYFINRKGEVKSTKGNHERILKYKWHKAGYPMVTLTQRIGRKRPVYVCVHKLVAFAFLGPPPTPYGVKVGCTVVDHIDECKGNCSADNLRWVSRAENNRKFRYRRRSKNNAAQAAAAKERHRIANRNYARRLREKQKQAQENDERRNEEHLNSNTTE